VLSDTASCGNFELPTGQLGDFLGPQWGNCFELALTYTAEFK
jgi:hypothetical protein